MNPNIQTNPPEHKKSSPIKRLLLTILILISFGMFLYCGWQLYTIFSEYKAASDEYSSIVELNAGPATDDPLTRKIDYDGLKAINSDFIGYIYLPGSTIDYPIVQGKDNSFYLNHTFKGQSNNAGCIFLDMKNESDFSQKNSTLYGHHMKNGSMFKTLVKYENQEYYNDHKLMYLYTKEKVYELQIFSAYVTTAATNYTKENFATTSEYSAFLNDLKNKSLVKTAVEVNASDNIITLSTCTYDYDDARFVVHGKLVEK